MESCEIKRCLEIWQGNPAFREAVASGNSSVAKDWNLRVDPLELRAIWDLAVREREAEHTHPAVRRFIESRGQVDERGLEVQRRIGQGNPTYRAWRGRQVNRYLTETDRGHANKTPHLACAIELSHGCSIGCDYCSVAAGPLRGVARLTPGNEKLYRSILDALEAFFGERSVIGLLYWATDPFDNRDYEKYLQLYGERLGWFPHTTTAAWHRNLGRTRALIEQAAIKREADAFQGGAVRLSVNTLEQLNLCMKTFTAQELASVHLVINNPESQVNKCAAGRGNNGDPSRVWISNACVTGFLINLVELTVQLITPSTDLERWPAGYIVYRSGSFQNAGDLLAFMQGCQSDFMSDRLDDTMIPRLRRDLVVHHHPGSGRLRLVTTYAELTFENPVDRALLLSFDEGRTIGHIVGDLMSRFDPALLYHALRRLRYLGLLEEAPIAASEPTPRPIPIERVLRRTVEASGI